MPKRSKPEIDYGRLCAAVQRSRLQLQGPRQFRFRAVSEFVGGNYSEEGNAKPVPVNAIASYVSIVGRRLIAQNPRVMLSTPLRAQRPTVKVMEAWANAEVRRMNVQETLSRVVTDALFSVGVCKVALATPSDAAVKAWGLRAGTPLVSCVDLDDLCVDMNAKRFDEVEFIGHRYRVPLRTVRDSKLYDRSRLRLTADYQKRYNQQGDERISTIGATTYRAFEQDFEDQVDLWEVYLPGHKLVCTFADSDWGNPEVADDGRGPQPLRVQRWVGPECGPYHVLGFQHVPGNLLPKGPVQDLLPLHLAINNGYRKILRQAARLKNLTLYGKNNSADAAAVEAAGDGELLGLDNPAGIARLVTGGADPGLVTLMTQLLAVFDERAGNLRGLGGLGPQSKTLGQDRMLNESASATITDMQAASVNFTESVMRALCWYFHHDPFRTMEATYSLPGLPDVAIERRATPRMRRQVPWEKLDLSVDPYSLQHQTPQTKAAALQGLMTNVVTPILPLLQQAGVTVDFPKFLQILADLTGMPEVTEIVAVQDPPEPRGESGPDAAAGPGPQGTRTYERVSRPADTAGADLNRLQTQLAQAERQRESEA